MPLKFATRVAKQILGSRQALGALVRLRSSGAAILAYHNIVPDGFSSQAGERTLHLPRAAFYEQIEELQRFFEIVSFDALVHGRARTARPPVAITFDDAYGGVLEHAAPWLSEKGIPYCVFVAPGLLGQFTWWDQVLGPGLDDARHDAVRLHALEQLKGDATAIVEWWRQDGNNTPAMPAALRIATEGQVMSLASDAMASIGAHSWTHRALPRLTSVETATELESCAEWLRARFRNYIPAFAYPYGLFDARVSQQVAAAGFEVAVTVQSGWMPRDAHRHFRDLARITVPGDADASAMRRMFFSPLSASVAPPRPAASVD